MGGSIVLAASTVCSVFAGIIDKLFGSAPARPPAPKDFVDANGEHLIWGGVILVAVIAICVTVAKCRK